MFCSFQSSQPPAPQPSASQWGQVHEGPAPSALHQYREQNWCVGLSMGAGTVHSYQYLLLIH